MEKKTKVMHIPPCNATTNEIVVHMMDEPCNPMTSKTKIQNVTEFKYLGVIVDNKINWLKQIEEIRNKLRKVTYFMYHLRQCSSSSIMKTTYFALAEAHLRFGITAWGCSGHCKVLQKLQDKLIKFLNKDDRTKIIDISNLYKSTMINTYYDIAYQHLKKITHNHKTRRKANGNFETPKITNDMDKRTLNYIIPDLYNELPEELREIKNPQKRKTLLKKIFSNKTALRPP